MHIVLVPVVQLAAWTVLRILRYIMLQILPASCSRARALVPASDDSLHES